jgi:hypothetical protein
MARLCLAWLGRAGQGSARQGLKTVFSQGVMCRSRRITIELGYAMQRKKLCLAWLGWAGQGTARQGRARQGSFLLNQARPEEAWHDKARLGETRLGEARFL